MKTHVQNPRGRATDRTPVVRDETAEGGQIKHGNGQGALCKETKKAAGKEPKVGGSGKGWVGRLVYLRKGGQMAGKWTGFSHFETALTRLFPLDSTQVVDFPLLSRLRVFWLRVREGVVNGQWTIGNG